MTSLLRWVFALATFLTLLNIAARLIGGALPPPPNPLLPVLFANPDGSRCDKPCLFGISPDNAKDTTDRKRLSQFPWMKDVTLSSYSTLSGWFDMGGEATAFSAESGAVAIYLADVNSFVRQPFSFSQPTFGDLITVLGPPTHVAFKDGFWEIWYNDKGILISSDD